MTNVSLISASHLRLRLRHFGQTIALLLSILALLGGTAWLLAGDVGLWFTLAAGAWAFFLAHRVGPELTLKAQEARRLPEHRAPQLHLLVAELARRARLPRTPAIYVTPDRRPNAYALGTARRAPSIVLTEGIFRAVDLRQLAAIVAHEMAHLKNGDVPLMNVANVARALMRSMGLVGGLMLLVNLPLALFGAVTVPWSLVAVLTLGPMAALVLQLALSRTREFDADMTALAITRDPVGMASALRRVERASKPMWALFFPQAQAPQPPRLFRSHPETGERVRRILEAAAR